MPAAAPRTACSFRYGRPSGLPAGTAEGHGPPHCSAPRGRIRPPDADGSGPVRASDRKEHPTLPVDGAGPGQSDRGERMHKKMEGRARVCQAAPACRCRHRGDACSGGDRRQDGGLARAGRVVGDSGRTVRGAAGSRRPPCGTGLRKIRQDRRPRPANGTAAAQRPCGRNAAACTGVRLAAPGPRGLPADGGCASRTDMRTCRDAGIRPPDPVQARCTAGGRGSGDAWGDAVREQLGDGRQTRAGTLGTQEREENRRYRSMSDL